MYGFVKQMFFDTEAPLFKKVREKTEQIKNIPTNVTLGYEKAKEFINNFRTIEIEDIEFIIQPDYLSHFPHEGEPRVKFVGFIITYNNENCQRTVSVNSYDELVENITQALKNEDEWC